MKTTPVVSARALTKRYRDITALDRVDIAIARGEVFGLIGPNGAGKTTLIRSIVGASRPSEGSVEVLGLDPVERRWALRQRIGYMPQQPALYADLTVRRNISFFDRAHRRSQADSAITRVLGLVGLSERADDPLRTLSGGMQQRVSLACAMVHEPELLLLDEPTAGVDPELRAAFWEHFRQLAEEGTTVIVSTHQMGEALMCDRVALLSAGEIVAAQEPSTLLRSTRATVRLWRNGRPEVVELDDYPDQLPQLIAGDVARLEIDLEPVDDIVLRLVRQGTAS